MIRRRRLPRCGRLAATEDGAVPIELALGVGLLLIPTALLVLSLPGWVERQSMAGLAAEEAARALAVTGTATDARTTARRIVSEVAANHGLAPGEVSDVDVDGSFSRGGTVQVTVTVEIPLVRLGEEPLGFTWDVTRAEQVDLYRSGG